MTRVGRFNLACWTVLIGGVAGARAMAAPTTLPSVFGDHMVLQRDLELPIWGRADEGVDVSVTVASETRTARSDANGAWIVRFPPLKATDVPFEVRVADPSGAVATYHDVIVGDVWVASGQSNMELALKGALNADAALRDAAQPNIRFFRVPRRPAADPQFDCAGDWAVCNPESAARFSAVAYFFARAVQQREHMPIGIIGPYAGGTKIEAWTSLNGFLTDPSLREYASDIETLRANLPNLQRKYETETVPAWSLKGTVVPKRAALGVRFRESESVI